MTREYIFTYPGKVGPIVKRFSSVFSFDGYVGFWRAHVGPIQFDSPFVCRGVIA